MLAMQAGLVSRWCPTSSLLTKCSEYGSEASRGSPLLRSLGFLDRLLRKQ